MNLRNIKVEGSLRTTRMEDDKEIQLLQATRNCRLTGNFYDLLFYNLLNGTVLGDDPSSSPTIETGFTFDLSTQTDASVTDDSDFTDKLSLTVDKAKVDKYETETSYVYEVVMDVTSATSTNAITGVSIYYTGVTGDCSAQSEDTKLIAKSIAPKGNEIYGATGLILNGHSVEVKFKIEIPK